MTRITTALLAATLVLAGSTAAFAHDHNLAGVNRTQADQIQAIELARRAGQLTRYEYNQLMAEQARIARLEQESRADGYVNNREYREIRNAQESAGAHIYQESHNGRVNYWRSWKWNHGYRY